MALLTDMRRSVWKAVDGWPALKERFAAEFRFEEAQALHSRFPLPAAGELPAIAIYPSTIDNPWALNIATESMYTLAITIWTGHQSLLVGEELWEEIIKALHQSGPPGGVPYVKAATGSYPQFGPMQVVPVALTAKEQGPSATQWTLPVLLRTFWRPHPA